SQIDNPQTTPTREGLNWWNTQWQYRKLITIDHTLVCSDLVNFPVLISEVTDLDLAAAAQPNGQDLVFIRYTDNSTILNHEIESYNHLNGQLTAWVKIPTLSATSDTKLWMYYGNPTCPSQEHITGTWDNNYVMVQHLNETGTTMDDSTSYHNNGVSTGTNYTDAGKIDGSQLYNGNDKIVVNNLTNSPTALTIETWVYRDSTTFIYIACKGTYSNTNDWILYLRNNQTADEGIDFGIRNHTAYIRKGDTPVNSWFHLTVTYDNGNVALFLNGINIANATSWPAIPNMYPHLGLGNDYMGTEGGYYPMTQVMLDEFRISNTARSTGWITTCYHNQNNPESFYSMGAEEQYELTLTTTSDPPQGGTITASPDPPYYYNDIVTLTATPNPGYLFDHWSGDLSGSTNPTTITMNANKAVTATFILEDENEPPVANDDYATVQENSTNNQINVLKNDSDPDGDNLSITSVKQPLHGNATTDGLFAYYTPNASYFGSDSFTYTISDGAGGTASATVYITVIALPTNNPPNKPSQPIPDNGESNVNITTDLWWLGGDPDTGDTVTYDVYFGMTTTPPKVESNQSNNTFTPILTYETTYYWRIVSWDNHNASTQGDLWSFTTQGEQHESINVTITRPLENSFYLRNFRLLRNTRSTTVYGPITITASVTVTNTTVARVEFYVDGKLKRTDDTAPYTYRWAPLRSFKHTIKVIAYDADQESAIDQITVFKWRLHPVLLIGGAYLLSKIMK
ncbi:MAG TPA: DUF2341 domain-containing protein, partial [Candidatus Thermoplasmatota archaeon]|nr:DUF2341 domain-containing protein [Candidatus Thermoplasmatota archaeon]